MTTEELRDAIAALGMRHTEVSTALGIDSSYLRKLIRGDRKITDRIESGVRELVAKSVTITPAIAERVTETMLYDRLDTSGRRRGWIVAELRAAKKANATAAGYQPDPGGWVAT